MPNKTVSLEASAYDLLKSARAPQESFSEAIHRLLSDTKPSFRQIAGALTPQEADAVKTAIRRMRAQEAPAEKTRIKSWRKHDGRRPRH
jgi:predicted CopG family antitoxin